MHWEKRRGNPIRPADTVRLTKYDPHDDDVAAGRHEEYHREYQRPEELLPPEQIERPFLVDEDAVGERVLQDVTLARPVQRLLDEMMKLAAIQPQQQRDVTLEDQRAAIVQTLEDDAAHICGPRIARSRFSAPLLVLLSPDDPSVGPDPSPPRQTAIRNRSSASSGQGSGGGLPIFRDTARKGAACGEHRYGGVNVNGRS